MSSKTLLTCFLLFYFQQFLDGKLVYLFSLSRHGSRAPNTVVERICPANRRNQQSYKVPFEELTEVGMNQMVEFGSHLRNKYVRDLNFLPPSLGQGNETGFKSYFRADFANRCVQSASTAGYGLYPIGPAGFPTQPIPVFTRQKSNENIFAAPKAACKPTLDADLKIYSETRAIDLMRQHKYLLHNVTKLCGVPLTKLSTIPGGEETVLAIKDISDGFVFDKDEGLYPMNGLTEDMQKQLKQLSFQMLMERYYSTKRMITYWCGGFPLDLLNNINKFLKKERPYLLSSYHGHRELLYGFAQMIGWKFDFPNMPQALNTSEIPPATSLIFELHINENQENIFNLKNNLKKNKDKDKNKNEINKSLYYLKTFIWAPEMKEQIQIKLEKCSQTNCPLEEFEQIIGKHLETTGTWEDICTLTKKKEIETKPFIWIWKLGIPTVVIITTVVIYRLYILVEKRKMYSSIK